MKLTREEVRGVFGVLIHTMDLDHQRSQDERHFLMRFLEAISKEPEDLEPMINDLKEHTAFETHVARIESRKARVYAMQQGLLLALSDGDYRLVEREGLRQLADRLGIDEVLFDELERWALEGSAWQIHGAALLAR